MNAVAKFEFVASGRGPVQWLKWLVLVAGCVTLALSFKSYRSLEKSVEQTISKRRDAEAASRKERTRLLASDKKKPDLTKPLAKALAPLIYPWHQVLLELEAANGEQVNVVKFEHSYRDRTVHLVVTASTYESIQALTSRLGAASGNSARWNVKSISRNPTGLRASIEGRYSFE